MTMAVPVVDLEPESPARSGNLARVSCSVFGVATQILFVWTAVNLFWFLRFGGVVRTAGWWWQDTLLAVGFAIPHSLLLTRFAQNRLRRWMPNELIGCFYCSFTCVSLLLLFGCWGKSETMLWCATGWSNIACQCGFYASWVALVYSLYWVGFGYQTGLTPWWYWIRGLKPPPRKLVVRGPFRVMRHPVYMSFLGLIWFTPIMSWDHVVLTAIWTLYVFAGSYFKDRRLLYFLGDEYRAYAQRVVGLPIIGFGSLRRMKLKPMTN